MTLTLKHDLDSVKVNWNAKYPGQGSLVQKLLSRSTDTHTHTPQRLGYWTTKVARKRYSTSHSQSE